MKPRIFLATVFAAVAIAGLWSFDARRAPTPAPDSLPVPPGPEVPVAPPVGAAAVRSAAPVPSGAEYRPGAVRPAEKPDSWGLRGLGALASDALSECHVRILYAS